MTHIMQTNLTSHAQTIDTSDTSHAPLALNKDNTLAHNDPDITMWLRIVIMCNLATRARTAVTESLLTHDLIKTHMHNARD